jgi:2'-5' RNA ligase
MPRLFVALDLPEQVRLRLQILSGGVPGAHWVRPESLHLTLRFIGEVDGGTGRDIDDALMSISPPGFDLALAGVGAWESKGRANALWVGVDKNPALNHLQAKIESALVRIGLEPEPRKFAPHVTLARLKDAPASRIGTFLGEHGLFRLEPFRVERFVLYSSFLSRSGAIYTPEALYPLRAPAEARVQYG